MIEKINWLGSLVAVHGTNKRSIQTSVWGSLDANNHLYVTDYGFMVATGYKNLKTAINL